ncbi:GPI mannosyltransferase 3-like [Dorcoceras hygrometricum]|uniref:Mannosyltransferase n=1 Tax=Dorcoceras hygrometricum TaxID=472368 RepID=A0A2Z7AG31_9LAMI|nr:GPI mannosyltransferase 3-like [Dorcoceras hygrometricum]
MRRRKDQAFQAPIDEDTNEKSISSQYSSPLNKIFTLCLVLRIINSLLVQTYFNPDEHWQSLEVAHRIAFGYGHLTWEWRKGLRSYLHPLLFAALYKVLAFLGLDSPWFMTRTPRLLQSIFAAFGDLYLYKLSKNLFGDSAANWALFAQLTNWFMFFCITRTLSNCLESVLTLVSLYYWPCITVSSNAYSSSSRKFALAMAALACAIRPTSAIIWIYIGTLELLFARDKLKFVLLDVVPIGGLVLGLTTLLDRVMYGSWVIVPLNFVKFNFLSSGGDYYGTHPWHWYFSQGFTVMIFTYLPFSFAGFIMSKQWKLGGLVAWVLGTYSLLGHKEFRFVLPVLPLALMFSGYSLAKLRSSELSQRKLKESSSSYVKLQMVVFFLLLTNIPMAIYMSMVHQRGTEDVMNYLSTEATENKVKNILFLTPCHATPYYSALHHNLPMRFLDCTPSKQRGMLDESDQFLLNPLGFAINMVKNWSLPSHVVMFDAQEKLLKEFLLSSGFHEIRRFFHAHFKVDRDLQSSVVVYELQG